MGKTKDKDKSELAKARAQRILVLRKALHYSREEFAKKHAKHGITYSALQSWEGIRWHGLTEKGAHKLVASFRDEGIEMNVEWLMYGIGKDPYEQAVKIGLANILPDSHYNRAEEPGTPYTAKKENVTQELKSFHQLNPGSIDAIVTDDGLAPLLAPGDHVAGHRYFDQDIEKGINHPCIIQTLTGDTLIRLLKPGYDIEYYTLMCTNPNTTVNNPVIEDIKLFSAAPIIWIRKAKSDAS